MRKGQGMQSYVTSGAIGVLPLLLPVLLDGVRKERGWQSNPYGERKRAIAPIGIRTLLMKGKRKRFFSTNLISLNEIFSF
jgi:hypothetical protein